MTDAFALQLGNALMRVPEELRDGVSARIEAIRADVSALPYGASDQWAETIPYVFACSEFIAHQCERTPAVLPELITTGALLRPYRPDELAARLAEAMEGVVGEADLKARLRRFRNREMVRIGWRDLCGWADLQETTAELSDLADACIKVALEYALTDASTRSGMPRAEKTGKPCHFIVFGLGKLGARELNFSSDVDLIFAYDHEGETDGKLSLSNHEFFVRLGQSLIGILGEITAEGFVFRVDMRLRPNGASGPLALSFEGTELYYQIHGREWERYALIKTRVVAGDRAAGEELLTRLKPFVFRRYLDYGTFESLRAMKALLEREVARKDMRANIKLGPGGIREIEFIVQALQLVHGGREPGLQARALLPVLDRLVAAKHFESDARDVLRDAYAFLRNTEHRLQMVADAQTHVIPSADPARQRLAFSMGFPDWTAFETALNRHRQKVQEQFALMFRVPQGEVSSTETSALAGVWLTDDDEKSTNLLRDAGYREPENVLALLRGLHAGSAYGAMSAESRARLDRLVPLLLSAAALTRAPEETLARLVRLLEAIGRRASYLALLVENPMALSQLVKLCAASPWIAGWIANHLIVLDELLDPRTLYAPLTRAGLVEELRARLTAVAADDVELQMELLREFRHSHLLRIVATDLGPGLTPEQVGAHLADIAETMVAESLTLAREVLVGRHGRPVCRDSGGQRGPGFAVIGYGKLGGRELGYASDLDMIFLYEGCEGGVTDGSRAISNEEFFARLGQRLIHFLTTRTAGGILYEVDMRLRPSGKSGPLVTSLAAFREYQSAHAWTWEHQALVRARAVAGAPELCAAFEAVRDEILRRPRDPEKLRADVRAMRARMAEAQAGKEAGFADGIEARAARHDSKDGGGRAKQDARAEGWRDGGFNLKHGRGGIVDIEFMVQYAVLRWAPEHPGLTRRTDTIGILETLAAEDLLAGVKVRTLTGAYRRYLSAEHRLKLMERGSTVDRATLDGLPDEVESLWRDFFGD